MNTLIFLLSLVLAMVFFYFGIKKGYLAVYMSLMVRGLRIELVIPTALIVSGLYLLYQAYLHVPFMIVWK